MENPRRLLPLLILLACDASSGGNAVHLAASGPYTCVVDGHGDVRCRGGYEGGGFDGVERLPIEGASAVAIGFDAREAEAADQVCALVDGRVLCVHPGDDVAEEIEGIDDAVAVAPPCAVTSKGEPRCWADGEWASSVEPFLRMDGIVDVKLWGVDGCALVDDGGVACWGNDEWGALGDGDRDDARVRDLADAVAIGRRVQGGCALEGDGQVWCWGWGDYGDNGDGTYETREAPVPVPGVDHAEALGAGMVHACAIQDGDVWCWGTVGDVHAFGDTFGPDAVRVAGVRDAVEVAGGWYHACALDADGAVWCVGDDDFGQSGAGDANQFVRAVGL